MLKAVLGVVASVALCHALSLEKVHLVDYNADSGNYLFRGDMPCNDTAFAIDDLRAYMAQRATEAGAPALPDDYYLTDISLNNVFDMNHFETEFWANGAHSDVGQFINWPLGVAGVLPPTFYNATKAAEMALGPVWWFDQMPARLPQVKTLVDTRGTKVQVIYVHCTAGCDRTGQFVGSYRMLYEGKNTTAMYALDTSECGRSPNWFGTNGLEWWCLYQTESTGADLGTCTGFASCELFGKCKPTNPDDAQAVADAEAVDEVIAGIPALSAPRSVLPLVADDAAPVDELDAIDRLNLVAAAIREAEAQGDAAYLN